MPAIAGSALGEDIRELGRRGDADKQHLATLDDLVGEVLPDVEVLGSFPSANDDVSPLDARRVVTVDRLGPHALKELAEVQNLASRRRSRIILRPSAVDRAVVSGFCILDLHRSLLKSFLFRCIRRKEYRRAVRTHYGTTRIHQAGYSHTIGGTAELAL